jgi:uncharacterized membrane protein YczE
VSPTEDLRARGAQLVIACVILGLGVGFLLRAAFGSDGWSTLIAGLSRALDGPYAGVNWVMAAILIALAWTRGQRPGPATIVQPLVVGLTANVVLDSFDAPSGLLLRALVFAAALVLMTVGVAAYLGTGLGAGAVEAAARAFDPPVSFRSSYSAIQGGGALIGWRLGAPIGIGTLVIIFGMGPAVQALLERTPLQRRRPTAPGGGRTGASPTGS